MHSCLGFLGKDMVRKRNTGRRYHAKFKGEEHWSKALQANEINANVVLVPHKRKYCLHHVDCKKARHKHRKREKTEKDTNILSGLYSRFCEWVSNKNKDSPPSGKSGHRHRTPSGGGSNHNGGRHRTMSSSTCTSDYASTYLPQSPCESVYGTEDSMSVGRMSVSSTTSSFTIISTSNILDDCMSPLTSSRGTCDSFYSSQAPGEDDYSVTSDPDSFQSPPHSSSAFGQHLLKYVRSSQRRHHSGGGHASLTATLSCPPAKQQPSTSITYSPEERAHLCATWPPTGRKVYKSDDEDDFEGSVFGDHEELTSDTKIDIRDSLGECSIPFSDLEFRESIRIGRRRTTHRGRWHGDVMIHTYSDLSQTETTEFWEEVSKLSMIRHENVALFMGACIEPPNLAIVTSVRKGLSLYQHIHVKQEKMPIGAKVNIARHIAQGMGYLHAKGIVLRKLNSKNVFLESKVKICVMDFGMAQREHDREDMGCIPKGHLTYVAPEIMASLRVVPPKLVPSQLYTNESDVYAFGTVLYELLSGEFPYAGVPSHSIIWQISTGMTQSLKKLKCPSTLETLIQTCWVQDHFLRPDFSEINEMLNRNVTALHKRHSSSEPERVNRVGIGRALFP